jgi:hypothetical protein
VSGFRVVLDRKGQEGRAGGRAQFPDWLIVVRVEAPSFPGNQRRIFDPELEFAIGANGGYQVGVNGWWEPLDLFTKL